MKCNPSYLRNNHQVGAICWPRVGHRLRIIRKYVTWVIMFGSVPTSDRIFIIRTLGYGTNVSHWNPGFTIRERRLTSTSYYLIGVAISTVKGAYET